MKKEDGVVFEFVCFILMSIGILASAYFVVKAGSWFLSEPEVVETVDEKDIYLEYQISELKCEVKGGELLDYTRDYYGMKVYKLGKFAICTKNNIEYNWKDGDWVNQETKILE